MMKGGGALSPTFVATFDVRELRAPRAEDRNVQEWAAVLASTGHASVLSAVLPKLNETAVDWRQRDGGLTPGQAGVNSRSPAETKGESPARVNLRVDAADLGELSVAIDRMDSGIRVTIAAKDDHAMRALEPERLALIGVLEESGVRVDSVTVVRQTAAGIPLAQGISRAAHDSDAAPRPPEGGRKKSQKKNHFVG